MQITGGCYCGEIRYQSDGEPAVMAQCHCRECQYISGGSPNVFVGIPKDGFRYTKGSPKQFKRSDLENPVVREFCPSCGTGLVSLPPGMPAASVKVGTLDDPNAYGQPQMAISLCDKQPFPQVPDGVATFDKLPG